MHRVALHSIRNPAVRIPGAPSTLPLARVTATCCSRVRALESVVVAVFALHEP